MTDGAFPDRLTQLRAKWDADPTSRVFLQLAEEYRHLGRVKEGLAVLEKGLKEHPGYLSALVAKGRCHLELSEGEAARAVLERVVKQDATQMVANKLLVRAYLETGEPAKARERLDLYSLLNDSDPEIEELRRRIKSMDRPVPAEEPRPMDADPFSLEPPPVPRREVREVKPAIKTDVKPDIKPDIKPNIKTDIFDFELAPSLQPRRGGDEIFALDGLRAAGPAPIAKAAAEEAEEDEPGSVLFPGLASRDRRRLYLQGLAAEGLFAFAAPPAVEPAVMEPPIIEPAVAPVQGVDESAWLEEVSATSYPLIPAEPEEPQRFTAPPAPVEEDLWGEEPAALIEPIEPIATATLGDLYLRQGHSAEAEQIFREVLQHEPDNATARAGMAQLANLAAPEPFDAHQLLAGFEPAPGQTGGSGVTARKVFLLNSYLKRLRRGRA
jgi:tetratricopeptide (TPR) repeat protein